MTAPAWMARFSRQEQELQLPDEAPEVTAVETACQLAGTGAVLSEADRDRAIALLHKLSLRGFLLSLDTTADDQIAIDSDGEVPPELLDRLKQHKTAILAVLKAQARAVALLKTRTDVATESRTVCIKCPWGRVWIVPERTAADRIEATWLELHEDPEGTLARCEALGNAVFLFEGRLLTNGPPLSPHPEAPSTHHPGGSR